MRDKIIQEFRPEIKTALKNDFSTIETFQNIVLRPILKIQNDVVILFINEMILLDINKDVDIIRHDFKIVFQKTTCSEKYFNRNATRLNDYR